MACPKHRASPCHCCHYYVLPGPPGSSRSGVQGEFLALLTGWLYESPPLSCEPSPWCPLAGEHEKGLHSPR